MAEGPTTWSVNPLALARLINNAQNPYVLEKDWKDIEEALKKAFQVNEVRHLFEAEGEKRPRLQLFQDLANRRELVTFEEAERLASALIEQYSDEYKDPVPIRGLLPYLLPIADAAFTTPDDPAAPPGIVVAGRRWYGNPLPAYVESDVSYLDPVQGMALDCYLIAALGALAWARPGWEPRVKATAVSEAQCQYKFYDENGAEDPQASAISRLVPEFMGRPVYAQSASRNEAWVAMFEKAYVMRRSVGPGQATREPLPKDYRLITDQRQSPEAACQLLMGGTMHAMEKHDKPAKPFPTVVSLCDDSRGVTRVPTIAWTWNTAGWSVDPESNKLGFDQTGLMAGHAYTVLGRIKPDRQGDLDYVVLRNPWGRAPVCREPDHKAGTWKPGQGENGEAEVELNQNGVFALRADWFDTCFFKVGWVTQ